MSNSTKYTETKIQLNDILYIHDIEYDDNDEQFVYIDNNLVIISYDSDDSVVTDDGEIILVS